MDSNERRAVVLETIRANGKAEVPSLAKHFGLSEMTIRRDLAALQQAGLVRRYHGGAVNAISRSYEPAFSVRAMRSLENKHRIGIACAELLKEGQTVMLDSGTTTFEVAKALRGRQNLTVITPSLRIAALLADEAGLSIICLGGAVRPQEHSLVGWLAEMTLGNFNFDVAVLGVGGVDLKAGLTEYEPQDAAIKRVALGRSQKLIVVSDSSKLGAIAFASVAPLEQVDILITDRGADDRDVKAIQKLGPSVRVV